MRISVDRRKGYDPSGTGVARRMSGVLSMDLAITARLCVSGSVREPGFAEASGTNTV